MCTVKAYDNVKMRNALENPVYCTVSYYC